MTDNLQQFISLIEKHSQDTGSILVATRREAARFYLRAGKIYSASLDREELPLDRRIHLCVQDDLDGAAIKAESNSHKNSNDLLFHLRQQQLLPHKLVKRISRDFFLAICEMAFYEWKNPTFKWKGRDQLAFDEGFQIAPLSVDRLEAILAVESNVLLDFADAINVDPEEVRRINVHSIPDRVYGPERDYDNYVYSLSAYNIPIGKIIDDSGLMGTANIIRAVTVTWKSHVITLSLDGNTIEYPWNDEGEVDSEDYEYEESTPEPDQSEQGSSPSDQEEFTPPINNEQLTEESSHDEYDDGHDDDEYDDGYNQSFTHPAVAAEAASAQTQPTPYTSPREEDPVKNFTAVPQDPSPTGRLGIPAPPRSPLTPPASSNEVLTGASTVAGSSISSKLASLRQLMDELASLEEGLDAQIAQHTQERDIIVRELQEKEQQLHQYDEMIAQATEQRDELRQQLAQMGR